jgi:TatD DNase family protein
MKYINIHVHSPFCDNSDVISLVDISPSAPSMSISTPYCTYGIHPWSLTEENAEPQLHQLETLLQNNAIVAIGEVGFDAVRGADLDLQYHIFEEVVSLSEHYRKPLIVHCVKAWDRLLSLYKNRKAKQTWIIHGFRGNYELALQLIKHNMSLSFGHKLLKNGKLQSVFSEIPIDSAFLETDNAEVNIVDVYQAAAIIRKIDEEMLKGVLFDNFVRFFFS